MLGSAPSVTQSSQSELRQLPVDQIRKGRYQPRTRMDEAALEELAASISSQGIVQPLLVRETAGGGYELIAGERRWRAAQLAGLTEVPAVVRRVPDEAALAVGLIENIQRSDLTALEEADGFQRLIDEYGHTQEDVARAVGKSRSHVANTLRLLALPPGAREHLEAGRLTAGHARALLASEDAERLADYVVAGGLSVRATEKLVQGQSGGKSKGRSSSSAPKTGRIPEKDADTRALEQSLTETLGLTVDITPKDEDRGSVTIHYQSLEQLDDLLAKLSIPQGPAQGTAVVSDALFGPEDDAEEVDAFQTYATLDGEDSNPLPKATSSDPEELDVNESDAENSVAEEPDPETSDGESSDGEDSDIHESDPGEWLEEADDSTGSEEGSAFESLMAQTESLLTSGEFSGDDLDTNSATEEDVASDDQRASSGDGGASALISGLLTALDAEASASVEPREVEPADGEDMGEDPQKKNTPGDPDNAESLSSENGSGPKAGPDDEIEFID
ncbi:MAG: ParB/RepB/Spo0J family partition protein [Burkholderiaceae bacterium]